MRPLFGVTAQPFALADAQLRSEYEHLSDECQALGHALALLRFMEARRRIHAASFAQSDRLAAAPPLRALVSAKTAPFVGGAARFFFSVYAPSAPHALADYFDKAVFDIGGRHFEWARGPDSLDADGIEFVVADPECPLSVSCVLYPDFAVPYFVVPEHLREITGTQSDFFAAILKKVTRYASARGLIAGDDFLFDFMQSGAAVTIKQVPFLLQSLLLPIAPIPLNFTLNPDAPRFNVRLTLPDFSMIQPTVAVGTPDTNAVLARFAAEKEGVDFLAAIARNPYEAIEAEIAGHAVMCELADETSENGPTPVVDPMHPARRSTPFYWQPWVEGYVRRFLEENKLVHKRYPSKK
jgi:hypothetical protein